MEILVTAGNGIPKKRRGSFRARRSAHNTCVREWSYYAAYPKRNRIVKGSEGGRNALCRQIQQTCLLREGYAAAVAVPPDRRK